MTKHIRQEFVNCTIYTFILKNLLRLFRINDPLRLVLIFLLLIGIRLTYLFDGVPLTALEIKWGIIGEKLSEGAAMYAEVWDNTPPLATIIFYLLTTIFGKISWANHAMALGLIIFQAYTFNAVLLKKNIHREKSYIPALLYVLFMGCCFDCMILSPLLISMTFLLLMLRNIFWLNDAALDEDVFSIGAYLGLAILTYLPNWIFIFFVLLAITFFRTASMRQYILFFYGLLLTVALLSLFYGWQSSFEVFFSNYLFTLFDFNFSESYVNMQSFAVIAGTLLFFLLLGIFKTYTERGFINYQNLCQLLMLIWTFFAIPTLFMGQQFAPLQILILFPPLVFFLTYFFLIIRRKWLSEFFFICFLATIGFLGYYSNYFLISNHYWRAKAQVTSNTQNKKVLVFGNNYLPYYQNKLATPYLNWEFVQKYFGKLEYYNITTTVYQEFEKEKPDLIIDEASFMPILAERIPILVEKYEQDATNKQWFWLKKK